MSKNIKFLIFVFFIIIVAVIFIFFDNKNSKNSKKIDTTKLSTLDLYLYNNFAISLDLDQKIQERLSVSCNNTSTSTTNKFFVNISCTNQNPVHKIVIGWSKKNQEQRAILKSLGDEQLGWLNSRKLTSDQTGKQTCTENILYTKYRDVNAGYDCVMELPSGKLLFSSFVFFEQKKKELTPFIGIMNIYSTTSADKVREQLLYLLENTQKNKLTQINFHKEAISLKKFNLFSTVYAGGTESGGGAEMCSSNGAQSSAETGGCGSSPNGGNGGEYDAIVCDINSLTSCYPLYCDSPTAHWDFDSNICTEGQVLANDDTDISISAGSAETNPININFSSDKSASNSGVKLSWTVNGGGNCTASGGWNGTLVNSANSFQVYYSNNTNDVIPINYSITCRSNKHIRKKTLKIRYLQPVPQYDQQIG